MLRIVLLLCLMAGGPGAWAADGGTAAATSGPNAESPPLHHEAADQANGQANGNPAQDQNCPTRPPLAQGAPSSVVVELDPDTLWRPRGAEVRFTIRNSGGSIGVAKVRVCFGWSSANGDFDTNHHLIGSSEVRSVSTNSGVIEYGAVVPFLPGLPNTVWWPRRIFSSTPYIFTGAYIVPVTDMVVEVTTTSGQVVVSTTQVGITNVAVAWLVVAVVLALVWLAMDRIARYRHIRGRNLVLRIISTRDGYASLSQLQIVLWTVVVGMSAIYVMTLSGNLINLSDGTLILLGIASGAALAARIPGLGKPNAGQADPVVAVPVVAVAPLVVAAPADAAALVPAMPEWSDLVIPDRSTREIDVTRLQMLAFTLITASFVLIKVVVDYEIPEIPANFLVLMGISNGVYVGGRRLPSQPKNGGVAPDA